MFIAKLLVELIGPGEIIWHGPLVARGDFHHVLAWPQPVSIQALIQDEILGLDQRLGEIHRIGHDTDMRQVIAVPNYLPGTNQFNKEFRDKHKIPEIAQRGGAETMYPEFRLKLNGAAK